LITELKVVMGVNIKSILPEPTVYKNLEFARDSTFYIDTSIYLYKYVSIYKEKFVAAFDSQINTFKKYNIKPVYVFDSKPPKEKDLTIKKRKEIPDENKIKITKEMVENLKNYFDENNVEWEDSPDYKDAEKHCVELSKNTQGTSEGTSEGTSCTSFIFSNDYDVIAYGADRIVRKHKNLYEVIIREELLKTLDLTQEQFIKMCIGIGTDFNPGGVKNMGPKKCYKLFKENKEYTEAQIDPERLKQLISIFNL